MLLIALFWNWKSNIKSFKEGVKEGYNETIKESTKSKYPFNRSVLVIAFPRAGHAIRIPGRSLAAFGNILMFITGLLYLLWLPLVGIRLFKLGNHESNYPIAGYVIKSPLTR